MTLADPTLSAPSPTRMFEKLSPVTGARLGEYPIADRDAVQAAHHGGEGYADAHEATRPGARWFGVE